MSGLPALGVFYDGPGAFAPRAAWALDVMLAPLGRRVALTRDPAAAAPCALAYAFAPVDGVPGQTRDRQIDCLRDVGLALAHDLVELLGKLVSSGNGQTYRQQRLQQLLFLGLQLLLDLHQQPSSLTRRQRRNGLLWYLAIAPGSGRR